MTEKFSFFDSILADTGEYDREYNAQEFTDYFATLVTTGVMKGAGNQLKVTANGSNMLSSLDTGIAFIEGRYYSNLAKLDHSHDTEVVGKNRIDRIVVRLDLNTESRFVKSFVKKGVASTNPVPPALQRDQFIYEISLAQVKIVGGQTYINANDVIDERGKADICPWAGSKILPNFDEETLEAHIHDYLEHIPFVVTTGTNTEYQATLDGITEYYDGLSVAIKMHLENGNAPRLNINGLGPRFIQHSNKASANIGDLKKDSIFTLRYNGNGFIIQGGASIQDATTTEKGIVLLVNNYLSPDVNKVPTANALFSLYDKLYGSSIVELGKSYAVVDAVALCGGNAIYAGAIAIGKGSNAYGSDGIAIGRSAEAKADGIAIGYGARATQEQSVAIGYNVSPAMSNDAKLGVSKNAYGPWNWLIPGQLYVSSTKNFAVMHPKPEKRATHEIRHGAVESPTTGDTLYRYSIKIDGETKKAKVMLFGENNEVELPVTEQQDGTYLISIILPDYWIYLNVNEQVFVNADKHFGLGFGEINRETETLELTLNTLKDYNVALFGTRNDENVQDWYIMGVEREIGVSWEGETSMIEETEILNVYEIKNDEVL